MLWRGVHSPAKHTLDRVLILPKCGRRNESLFIVQQLIVFDRKIGVLQIVCRIRQIFSVFGVCSLRSDCWTRLLRVELLCRGKERWLAVETADLKVVAQVLGFSGARQQE